ncbi:Rne/Rng family ribonuclease [Granulicella arctica]|uniref:Ribonuclease G n=1 Tax=Granulicella arctica TaxID=940613 RepID=A0A7Y9TIU1_9BACT|nr:Rne/Rng family ribonuclease [Granulicella arctica]NYF81385.1 ribonuclease G [Granulicella arctica]
MSKEIYISSTPHETRLAIVENDALTEIYYERENEYTLAGSIYNGKVTRVLPGMQSSFVDIGLERDAFLYITDFMEEAPDSAEFETASIGDGAPREARAPRLEASAEGQRPERSGNDRGDRGDRNGRSRRGRGDRGDRTPSGDRPAQTENRTDAPFEAPRPVAQAPNDSSFTIDAADGSEIGEGAPGADGSRRWRGRRGRRRGRGPGREDAARSATPGSEQPIFPAEAEAGSPDDFTRDTYTAEPAFKAEGVGEPAPVTSVDAAPAPSYNEGRRNDRSGNDRGGRGDRNGRGRDRGRNDRGGRDDRGPRAPRGFAPSQSLYGVDSAAAEESFSDAPAGEPIILPGESLSKYRKGEDAPVGKPEATIVLTPLPSTEYTIPSGWDGGSILPGESLSRHRRNDSRAEVRTDLRTNFTQPEPAHSVEPAPVVQEQDGPSVAETPESQPEVALAAHPEQVPAAEISHETVHESSPAAEYEPEEASASYRVDPIPPSEYRQSAPVEEHAEEVAAVDAGPSFGHTHFFTPEPEAPVEKSFEELLPEHEITTLHASGEMFSESLTIEPVSIPASQEQPEPTSPIHHEAAILNPADLVEEHVEEIDESEEHAAQTFAPGTGELEEELIDDDEYEVAALHAGYADEHDDLEEETLEGAADLGTMLREMSIDQITRTPEPGVDEEEEDFEEDFLEESEEIEANGHEFEEAEEGSEEYARTAEAAGDFSTEFREPEANDTASADGQSYNERRGGRRDARRGGRDRDRRGGDSSGRPRNTGGGGDRDRGRSNRVGRSSMQSTNLPAISELLKPGQEILVQIAKEPIAKKGARITSHIALPGRFLVFMPTVNHTGVSRKIESDGERRRLKEILLSEKGEAAGGFIVRTAAAGASEEELRSDLRFLLNLWADIKQRSESSKSPALIYHDLNLVERILRDQVTDNFSAIWVDTESEYERVLRFLQRFQPSLIRRVKLYLKETPLFEQFGITEEINKALRSKVWLKSGGSIVINQTEALVAIDINTGKFVGKTARLEDTIVKTNLDAIPEIVRQIRLRDLGGIIIIDFIDMDERKNRNKVMAALEEELKSDRAPSKVLQFNDFGLVAITRKRVKQSLERTLSTTCNVCVGTGMVKSAVTVCNDIYIEMRKMHKHLDKGDVMLRVHPDVVKQLKSSGTKWLQEMEEMSGKTILVKSDPSLHPEQFDIH